MTLAASHSHVIMNWVLRNQFTFKMVAVSWGYMMAICNLHRQLLASNTNGKGIREDHKLWLRDVLFNDCTTYQIFQSMLWL